MAPGSSSRIAAPARASAGRNGKQNDASEQAQAAQTVTTSAATQRRRSRWKSKPMKRR